jgi:hypothetical protein
MSQRSAILSCLLSLFIGFGIGLSLVKIFQSQSLPDEIQRADSIIKCQTEKIQDSVQKIKEHEKTSDSLKIVLSRIRKEKAQEVKNAMANKVELAKLNKELEEFEKGYNGSRTDSSIYFISDELGNGFKTDSTGLQVVQGLIVENRIQKKEIENLDSSIIVKDKLIGEKDIMIQSILVREQNELKVSEMLQTKYRKKSKTNFWKGLGIGIGCGIIGGLLIK